MSDDNSDTSPNTELIQLIYDELVDLRFRFRKFEERLDIVEHDVNSLKLSIELVQNQYQENGSAIANLQRVYRSHGELMSRLISKTSQPPPVEVNDERSKFEKKITDNSGT
jgi:chromosome segregation ATPase